MTFENDDSRNDFWHLKLGITGMTCSSCSNTIETHLKRVLGTDAPTVEINLATMTASIQYMYQQGVDRDEQKYAIFEMIKDEIECVGFDCEFLEATVVMDPRTRAGDDLTTSQSVSINIPESSRMKAYLFTIVATSGNTNASDREPTLADLTRLEIFLKSCTLDSPHSGIMEVRNCQQQGMGDDTGTSDHVLSLRVTIDDEIIGLRKLRDLVQNRLDMTLSMSSLGGGIMMANRLIRQQKQETAKHLRDLLVALSFTIPILIISMVLPSYASTRQILLGIQLLPGVNLNGILLFLLSSPVQWIVGYRFHRKALHSLSTKVFGMDFLISTGTTAAYMYSCIGFLRGFYTGIARNHDVEYFETSSVLITVVVIGKYLEVYAKGKTTSAIHKLTNLRSKTARLVCDSTIIASGKKFISAISDRHPVAITSLDLRDNTGCTNSTINISPIVDEEIDAVLIERYDFIRLVSGESIPADGTLTHGSIGVDESMMTGESAIISKRPGDHVFAGTTVIEGSGVCYVTASGDDSTLGKIVTTVQDAQAAKPPIQEIADRVAHYFVPVVAVISLLTFIVWISAWKLGFVPESWYTISHQSGNQENENIEIDGGGNPILFAFLFALSVWVSACPCSFGLATPTAILVSTGVAAKNGILFRKGSALQHCAEVDTIAFDKTGTLTMGKSAVSDFYFFQHPCNPNEKSQVFSIKKNIADFVGIHPSQQTNNVSHDPCCGGVTSTGNSNISLATADGGTSSAGNHMNIVDAFMIFQFIIKAESKSNHPLARGIVDYCKTQLDYLLSTTVSSTSLLLGALESAMFSQDEEDMEISFDVIPGRGLKLVVMFRSIRHAIAEISGTHTGGNIKHLINSSSILNVIKDDIDCSFSIVIGSETLMISEGCVSTSMGSSSHSGIPVLPKIVADIANSLRSSGKVTIFLGIGHNVFAVIGISDILRPESRQVISDLHESGYLCYMITGDEERTAMAIGQAVGIPLGYIFAGAKPHDKESFIAELQARGRKVLFIGDGTNDSPALARSNVGIAMAGGTDIAIEAGDVVFCRNSLELLPIAISIARKTLRRIKINYFWALIYNCFLIPLAAGVLYPSYHFSLAPMMAGSAMAMSSISIVVSSLMLGLYEPPRSMNEQQMDKDGDKQSYSATISNFFSTLLGSSSSSSKNASSQSLSSAVSIETEIMCQCPSSLTPQLKMRSQSWPDAFSIAVSRLSLLITSWGDSSPASVNYTSLPSSSSSSAHVPLSHLGDNFDDEDCDEVVHTFGRLKNRYDRKSLTVQNILFNIPGMSIASPGTASFNDRNNAGLKRRHQISMIQRSGTVDGINIHSGGCSCGKSNCKCGQDCRCGHQA